jgi:hypothetical protein
MEQGRQEAAEQAEEEVSGEAAAVVAGWEAIVLALDPAGNVSALSAGHVYHIKGAYPAITRVAPNAEQRWYEVKSKRS